MLRTGIPQQSRTLEEYHIVVHQPCTHSRHHWIYKCVGSLRSGHTLRKSWWYAPCFTRIDTEHVYAKLIPYKLRRSVGTISAAALHVLKLTQIVFGSGNVQMCSRFLLGLDIMNKVKI